MANQGATFKIVKIREWLTVCCDRGDLTTIDRMFRNYLNKIGPGIDAPLWEKEKFYETWLEMDFSPAEWQKAKTPSGFSYGYTELGLSGTALVGSGSRKIA